MLQGARREMSSSAATAEKREVNASGLLLHESQKYGVIQIFSCSAIVIPSTDYVVLYLAAMRQALISERIECATVFFEGLFFKKIVPKKNCVFRTYTSDTLVRSCIRDSRGKKNCAHAICSEVRALRIAGKENPVKYMDNFEWDPSILET